MSESRQLFVQLVMKSGQGQEAVAVGESSYSKVYTVIMSVSNNDNNNVLYTQT